MNTPQHTPDTQSMDDELFTDNFHKWLEQHNTDLEAQHTSGRWIARVDVNQLKAGIVQLILADRKKHELQARLSSERDTLNTLIKAWNGMYDDANDILQLLIDNSRLGIKNLEQELEKL